MNSKWIWYPGEFEILQANKILFYRQYRGVICPPFWKVDGLYYSVFFFKKVNLEKKAQIYIKTDSIISVIAGSGENHIINKQEDGSFYLPEGEYTLCISAYNPNNQLPCIFVYGPDGIYSDETWFVDNVGSRADLKPVGFSDTMGMEDDPNNFKLSVDEKEFKEKLNINGDEIYDFGRETIGYLKFHGITGAGKINAYYGESIEEAKDTTACETLDCFEVNDSEYTSLCSRGFRYVNIKCSMGVSFEKITLLYEYLPLQYRGDFKCSSDLINDIYDTSVYTLHLNSREVFLDGIKRDRWVWSGDAYQSFLLNYYIFFDKEINHRTLWALRGKGCIKHHINHILDYSFYWFNSLYDHYMYMNDTNFLKSIYYKAEDLMSFCLKQMQSSESGFIEGRGEDKDWVFIDWADMSKEGALSTEQILLYRSLWVMGELSQVLGYNEKAQYYHQHATNLKDKIFEVFYDKETGVFYHNLLNGKVSEDITRYANIFAIMYDMLDDDQKKKIIDNVILNDDIQKLVTPYAMFYELISLCKAEQHEEVISIIEDYWGGMIKLGATTFWELYDPAASNHLEMYDRPYGKSLCHAWSASPIYILGRYYLGVYPTKAGYKEFNVEPRLGNLEWIKGEVPTPKGNIKIYMDKVVFTICNDTPFQGNIIIGEKIVEIKGFGEITIDLENYSNNL